MTETMSRPGASSYTIPSAGVLTGYSYEARATGAVSVRPLVFRAAGGTHFTIVGKPPLVSAAPGGLDSFPARIPVQPGDILGAEYRGTSICAFDGAAGDAHSESTSFNPDTQSDYDTAAAPPEAGFRVNISAVLEPDVDGDGYGDVTQDACPQSAQTQAVCPAPETKKSGRPHVIHHHVVLRFKSSITDSTFTCSIDGKKFKECHSPLKKHVRPGKHVVEVQAISPVGIPDPTPLKVKFRVAG